MDAKLYTKQDLHILELFWLISRSFFKNILKTSALVSLILNGVFPLVMHSQSSGDACGHVSCAPLSDLNAHTMDQPAANSVSLCLWPLQFAQNKVQVSVVQLIYNGEQAVIKCWCHGIPHHSFGESSSLYPNKINRPLAGCNLSHVRVPSNHVPLLLSSVSWLYL